MKTNIKTTLFSPKTLAVMGLCIAMTVVLDKFVMIPVGSAIRIGLGALPVIFASIYISPVAGAITALTDFKTSIARRQRFSRLPP